MLPTTTAFDGPASLFEPFDPDADESGAGTTDEPTVSMTVPDGPIVTDAETTAILTLSDAPDGLSGYRISLSVEDAAIARVEGAAYPEALQDGLTKSPEQDTSSATLEALDIDDAIGAGATDVELGSVKLVGEAPGEVTLTAEVHDLDDDTGTALDPATSDGALTVSPLSPVGDNERLPGDLDGDGRYEDVDGDGQASYNDVVELFEHRREPAVADNPSAFDFNENGRLDYDDIVALFEEI